ncbi:MAG TPA: hypothetical protein PLG17_10905, partial [Thermodesulfobacteriota bacterium]|nr:hypothetical protein [Thermodesulfobacteriota bacterium]
MSDGSQSESRHLSFSELAWFALLIVIMIFAYCQNEARRKQKELERVISSNPSRIAELEREKETLKTELVKWKQTAVEEAKKAESAATALEVERANNRRLQAENETLCAERTALNARVEELEGDKRRLAAKCEELEEKQKGVPQTVAVAVKEAVEDANNIWRKKLDAMTEQYLIITRDMIDIKGKLGNVACIMDCSSSIIMDDKKWGATRDTMGTWIRHLPIQRLMLITTYDDEVDVYDNTYMNMASNRASGKEDPNVSACMEYLEKQVRAGGYSDTYGALKAAYSHNPDTIILFTDGSPNRSGRTSKTPIDVKEMKRIEELVGGHKKIPINVIGFGDYFNQTVGDHIRRITDLTEGTFIGR